MSADAVLKITKTITTIELRLPLNGTIISTILLLTLEHRSLKLLFNYLRIWGNAMTKSGESLLT